VVGKRFRQESPVGGAGRRIGGVQGALHGMQREEWIVAQATQGSAAGPRVCGGVSVMRARTGFRSI
jgi:hypothetical protein